MEGQKTSKLKDDPFAFVHAAGTLSGCLLVVRFFLLVATWDGVPRFGRVAKPQWLDQFWKVSNGQISWTFDPTVNEHYKTVPE